MSATPITDHEESMDNGDTQPLFEAMRKLERELTATKAQLADMCHRLKGHPDSKFDGENGLAAATMRGYEQLQAENEVMREAIKEAHVHLSGFLGFHADRLTTAQMRSMSECLANLTPFLP